MANWYRILVATACSNEESLSLYLSLLNTTCMSPAAAPDACKSASAVRSL